MTSIYDIAKFVNLSPSTVSFVLNGRGKEMRISSKTIERVEQAASKLNYIPNVSARQLILSDNYTRFPVIALLWSTSQHFSYLNHFFQTAQEMIFQREVPDMRFTIIPYKIGELNKYDSDFFRTNCNCIITPQVNDDDFLFLEGLNLNMPVILLYGRSKKHSVVTVDNMKAGKLAAEIFADRGVKKAAFLFEESIHTNYNAVQRRDGYIDQCQKMGIEVELIELPEKPTGVRSNSKVPAITMKNDTGAIGAEILLSQKERSQAVFVQNDRIGFHFIRALTKKGISIPDDVMIIAYGSHFYAENSDPSLTTIHHDYSEISREVVFLTAKLLNNPSALPCCKIVDTPVIFRESCL